MWIKYLAHFEGPEDSRPIGSEHDVEQAEAIRLIEAGFAVPVARTPIEKAVRAPSETRPKRKKK